MVGRLGQAQCKNNSDLWTSVLSARSEQRVASSEQRGASTWSTCLGHPIKYYGVLKIIFPKEKNQALMSSKIQFNIPSFSTTKLSSKIQYLEGLIESTSSGFQCKFSAQVTPVECPDCKTPLGCSRNLLVGNPGHQSWKRLRPFFMHCSTKSDKNWRLTLPDLVSWISNQQVPGASQRCFAIRTLYWSNLS